MAANLVQVRKLIGASNKVRLQKLGFTIDDYTITGGTEGKLKKWIPGGAKTISRLRKAGIYT